MKYALPELEALTSETIDEVAKEVVELALYGQLPEQYPLWLSKYLAAFMSESFQDFMEHGTQSFDYAMFLSLIWTIGLRTGIVLANQFHEVQPTITIQLPSLELKA